MDSYVSGVRVEGFGFKFWYCPHPVTVYTRGHIKGYIKLYYTCYPTITEWGQYPSLR